MFNLTSRSCPYQNWTSVARERCPNPDHFHCLKDEYGRIGWVCSASVWVEKDRCPIYNVGAKKLDTTSCSQTRCPPYNYRSNDIDVEYACRYIMDRESSTSPFTTNSPETNKNSSGIIITLAMLTLFTIVVIVTGILILKYRRKSSKTSESRQEESKDLMQETAIDTLKTAKGRTNSFDQAKFLGVITEVQGSGRQKSSKNTESCQESKDLAQETAIKTLITTEGQTNSFDQAKHFLIKERMVVITGVQGSGKTFLAKSLVNSLLQDGYIKGSFSICTISKLQIGPSEIKDFYIIDDIFYELQSYEKFKETLKALNQFISEAGETYLIITIPTYTWMVRCEEFLAKFYNVHVDLDVRGYSEKLTILEFLKAQHDLSSEVLERLSELQNDIINSVFECIGFPALISLMCKQTSVEKLNKCLSFPLQTLRDEISSIRNASTVEERGKYLVLAYMSLKGGKMNVQNIDKKLFDSLKKKYVFEFEDMDLRECCEGMVGYYVFAEGDGCYELESNILKKIVFVSVAKDSTTFVKDNCKNDYFRYVIESGDTCPRDVDKWYTECFTRG